MCLDYFITSPVSTQAIERTQIGERGNESYEAAILVVGTEGDEPRIGSERRKTRALDNFRDFARAVVTGTDHFIHHGWVHPHPVGFGRRCSRN